jgi:hypothetical protein
VSTLYESVESGKYYFNIPVAMEAFLLVAYENNYRKYKVIIEDNKAGEEATRCMLGSLGSLLDELGMGPWNGLALVILLLLLISYSASCLFVSLLTDIALLVSQRSQAQSTTTSLLSIHKPIVVRKNLLDGVLMV